MLLNPQAVATVEVPVASEPDIRKPQGRRLSARDFFREIEGLDLSKIDSTVNDSWELVLGSGDRAAADALDIIMLGHHDGYA